MVCVIVHQTLITTCYVLLKKKKPSYNVCFSNIIGILLDFCLVLFSEFLADMFFYFLL